MFSYKMAKTVTFSNDVTIYLENPDLSKDYRLSRIDSYQQFLTDCKFRHTPLLTPILQTKHRAKMKNYIEKCNKT